MCNINSYTLMKKVLLFGVIFFCPFFIEPSAAEGGENSERFSVSLTGFVKSDYWLDSRSVVASREDLFLLYPAKMEEDPLGRDLNADPVFNFSAITSRVAALIKGPDAFGAAVSGMIEADFSGVSNADINGFRLRHAFVELNWEKWGLLLGQWWHPIFAPEVAPSVISLNTGAPFQPFIRSPQATLSYTPGGSSTLVFSVIGQRDNVSDGPAGPSSDYLRKTAIPNMHLQWKVKTGNITAGLAGDYKYLRPRELSEENKYTSEKFGSYAFMAFGGYRKEMLDIRARAIYGQNLSEHLMLGGYIESETGGGSGSYTYTPLDHLAMWTNFTYGNSVKGGLFLGFAKNLGTRDHTSGKFYGRGEDIGWLYRISPSLQFRSGSVSLCAELELTAAAYGTPGNRARVEDTYRVSNTRMLFTALYHF